jgi:hypothetical protein
MVGGSEFIESSEFFVERQTASASEFVAFHKFVAYLKELRTASFPDLVSTDS